LLQIGGDGDLLVLVELFDEVDAERGGEVCGGGLTWTDDGRIVGRRSCP